MQRSSETIGTIAAALAKAQAQLVNPEKSLIGTIRSDQTSGAERSFRYARECRPRIDGSGARCILAKRHKKMAGVAPTTLSTKVLNVSLSCRSDTF
jgi:hypothetical protein